MFLAFLLRKAETKKEREEREQREERERLETGTGEDTSREMYRRYKALFNNFSFAQRALVPLTELSENIKIIVDDSKATGFEFENITAYNRIIDRQKSSSAYNILALSLSENLDLLSNYEFTEKKENGDVILPPQVPPAPKKTGQELGEEELTIDESFDIFSEGESTAPTATKRTAKDKERKIEMNPEINLTELFEKYKELASKTYDEFQDKNGETLTFEKAFLYLHYNRHNFLPENAKNTKIRGADIARAKKLARKKKEESRRQREEEISLGFGDAFTASGMRRKKTDVNSRKLAEAYKTLRGQRNEIEGNLKQLDITLQSQDKLMDELKKKKGNIKVLARESFKQQLPEIKSLYNREALQAARDERKRRKEVQTRVAQGDIDLDNPTSAEERVLAKANKKILDLLNEEQEKQKEVRETIRDAARFLGEIESAMESLERGSDYKIYAIEELESQIVREEEKEKPDLNLIRDVEKRIKNRKEYNKEVKNFREEALSLATLTRNSGKLLNRLNPKLRELGRKKEEYSSAIEELIDLTVVGAFTELGMKVMLSNNPPAGELSQEQQDKEKEKGKLKVILNSEERFAPLLSDEEAVELIKEMDKFIRMAYKIEQKNEFLETQIDVLEDFMEKEEEY